MKKKKIFHLIDGSVMALLNSTERKRIFLLIGLMLLFSFIEAAGLGLIIPYVTVLQHYNDGIQHTYLAPIFTLLHIPENGFRMVWICSLLFLLVVSIRAVMNMAVEYYTARFSAEIIKGKAIRLHTHYLEMPYLLFLKRHSTHLMKNCTHTILTAARGIHAYLQFLFALCTAAILSLLMIATNFRTSLVVIALFSGASFLLCVLFRNKNRTEGEIRESAFQNLCKDASESFLLFRELRVMNMASFFTDKFKQKLHLFTLSNQRISYYPLAPSIILEYFAIVTLLTVVVTFIALGNAVENLIAPLFFYAAMGKKMLPTLNKITTSHGVFHSAKPSIEIIAEELSECSSSSEESIITPPATFNTALKIQNLSFFYEEGKPILNDVDLLIKKNSSIAFVGRSGAGKSTFVDIFASLLQPQTGDFYIDDIKVPDFKGIQQKIGYVPQMITLLDNTILNNIVLNENVIDHDLLAKAVSMAHLDEFIESLEDGLHTIVGERGIMLSGGQRQRIGIARALYLDPEILVFDEATSSLDTISEQIITQTIEEMSGSKTILVIAHRLTTIQRCDIICLLNNGKIVASGSHQTLLATSPDYRELNAQHTLTSFDTRGRAEHHALNGNKNDISLIL